MAPGSIFGRHGGSLLHRRRQDGRLARNPLKGALDDALHEVMYGAGHNLRLILAALRLLCARFGLSMQAIITALLVAPGDRRPVCC